MPIIKVSLLLLLSYIGKGMATKAKGTIQGNNLREHTYMPIIKVSLLLSYIGKDMATKAKGTTT
jgi:hypothetical protein